MSNTTVTFEEYLKRKIVGKGEQFTHTRIGDKEFKISGGLYNIKDESIFLEKYYKNVFVDRKKEYLTEKQKIEDAPILIDIDLRYSTNITKRQHTRDHIIDLIELYGNAIKDLFDIPNKFEIEIFVMEKSDVNILENKTKDGIHIIFGISMHKAGQLMLRKKVLENLNKVWDELPFINGIEELIDEGITKGTVNWQMYGSRKPNQKAYLITQHLSIIWDQIKEDFTFINHDLDNLDTKKYLHKLSAHCTCFPKLEINKQNKAEFDNLKENFQKKKPKKTKLLISKFVRNGISNAIEIKNQKDLDDLVEHALGNFDQDSNENTNDYELKETHDFTMILPESYWGEGSYNKWIRVGWALKNTNQKLLPTWLKFSSQQKNFDWTTISDLIQLWDGFDFDNQDGLTDRSIMYWAKNENRKEYERIRQETVSYFIELTVKQAAEWDFANVLYQMYKDEFICVSIKNNIWYEYRAHRWYDIDSGNSLRLQISRKMHDIYMRKTTDAINSLQKIDQTEDCYESLRKRSNKLADICVLLKKTNWKNNIMREAKELFYNKDFLNKLDSNPYLLCFNNCVVDFKLKIYRDGQPEDYISKSTNIEYIPFEKINDKKKY